MPTSPGNDARVDPRIVRTREVVHQAVLAELAAVGFAGFTVESVAARAGVGKSTLYRHWTGRLDLVVDTLDHRAGQPPDEGPEDSPRDRVRMLVSHLVESMTDPALSPMVPALVEAAERDDRIAERFHDGNDGRRAALVAAVASAVAAGQARSDLDPELAALALAGAVVYRRLLTGEPFGHGGVDDLVATVLGPPPG